MRGATTSRPITRLTASMRTTWCRGARAPRGSGRPAHLADQSDGEGEPSRALDVEAQQGLNRALDVQAQQGGWQARRPRKAQRPDDGPLLTAHLQHGSPVQGTLRHACAEEPGMDVHEPEDDLGGPGGRPLVHVPMNRSRAKEALLGQRSSRTANSMGPLCLEVTRRPFGGHLQAKVAPQAPAAAAAAAAETGRAMGPPGPAGAAADSSASAAPSGGPPSRAPLSRSPPPAGAVPPP